MALILSSAAFCLYGRILGIRLWRLVKHYRAPYIHMSRSTGTSLAIRTNSNQLCTWCYDGLESAFRKSQILRTCEPSRESMTYLRQVCPTATPLHEASKPHPSRVPCIKHELHIRWIFDGQDHRGAYLKWNITLIIHSATEISHLFAAVMFLWFTCTCSD